MCKKDYFKVLQENVKENRFIMLQMFILYNLECYDIFKELKDEDKKCIFEVVYNYYLDANDLYLEQICEFVSDYLYTNSEEGSVEDKNLLKYDLSKFIQYKEGLLGNE